MDYAFTIVKKSIIIHGNELEIYHGGFIEKKSDYDSAIFSVMNYLFTEGFLENRTEMIEHIHVFDYAGKQVIRENMNI